MKDWDFKRSFLGIVAGLVLLVAGANPGYSFTVEKLPFMSDFHVGLVNGIGNGINIGLRALFPLDQFFVGPEVEQIMSDINYSATINASRFGVVGGMNVYENTKAFLHLGYFNFMPSDVFNYIDASGHFFQVSPGVNYKGLYWGLSADYTAWDFIFTIKYLSDSITDGGTINELDFNVGRSIQF